MLVQLLAAGGTMGLVYAVIDREARPNEFLGSETLQQVYLGNAT